MRVFLMFLGLAAATSACFSPAQVRSARTLEPGEHEVGVTLSGAYGHATGVTWYNGTSTDSTKPASTLSKINGAPELAYHYGIIDNLEAGVRLGGGAALLEADAGYRFARIGFGGGVLHATTGAIVGVSQAKAIAGGRALLPVRATWDITPSWGLTLGGHVGYRWVNLDAVNPHSVPENIDELGDGMRWMMGNSGLSWGGGLSGDWHDDEWVCRFFAEFDTWSGQIGEGKLSDYAVHVVQAGFAVGYKFGKDAAALRKAHDDLDALTKPKVEP